MWENLQERIDNLHNEIRAKKQEIKDLEQECEALRGDLAGFESRYNRIVKPIADRVEAVRNAITELRNQQLEKLIGAGRSTDTTWSKRQNGTEENGDLPMVTEDGELPTAKKPIDDRFTRLKTVFRRLARRYHPDLAQNEQDRERRTRIMSQINNAHQEGDLESLEVLDEATPEEEQFMLDEMVPMAVMVIRKLQRQVEDLDGRISNLKILRHDLRYGHIMELKLQESLNPGGRHGNIFLKSVADNLQNEYWVLTEELKVLKREMR